ncbi:hypothetical protein GUJ93_ZPchr0001g29366 [Zizania palustris]|uniref:non-specific serine/threonine protein kinase n=1 Tax=Zizania palustris TaxID=103762 RepID=A0A8J5VT74_ZIZPA|nr:hypothetical protein GUJ93_ZPchr0001g29366 [Zizania palustris]
MGPSCTKLLALSFLLLALHRAAPQLPWLRGGRRGGRRQPGDARVPDQPGPGLTGGIPASLGRLASLQSLVLVENRLTGAVPAELGALVRLRRLVLSGNGLSGQIPATLGNDPSDELLIVDMSNNSLTGSLPSSLGGLKGLLKMDISNNLLHGSLPPELAGLGSLTLLDLRNNSFTGGLPPFCMASLQDLLLSNNPLRFLALAHNRLSGDVPPNLGALYLNGNNLTETLQFSPAWCMGHFVWHHLCFQAP